jgi:hypothetical protein
MMRNVPNRNQIHEIRHLGSTSVPLRIIDFKMKVFLWITEGKQVSRNGRNVTAFRTEDAEKHGDEGFFGDAGCDKLALKRGVGWRLQKGTGKTGRSFDYGSGTSREERSSLVRLRSG